MESNLDEYNSFYDRLKIQQLQARGEVKSHKKIAWKLQLVKTF